MIILQDQVLVPVDYPQFPQYHGEMFKAMTLHLNYSYLEIHTRDTRALVVRHKILYHLSKLCLIWLRADCDTYTRKSKIFQ